MSGSEIANKLAEIRRLPGLASSMAPARNTRPLSLDEKERDMIRELLGRLATLAAEVLSVLSLTPEPIDGIVEQDVLVALMNLGCNRPHAELAVGRAKAALGASPDFEALFRKALELVN